MRKSDFFSFGDGSAPSSTVAGFFKSYELILIATDKRGLVAFGSITVVYILWIAQILTRLLLRSLGVTAPLG